MSRSPLSYPLNRGADTDAGGAADLQTDIMRFMAILSMCLLAIFALVQSIPLAPVGPEAKPDPVGVSPLAKEPEKPVTLTRPKPQPRPLATKVAPTVVEANSTPIATKAAPTAQPIAAEAGPTAATAAPVAAPAEPEQDGFTLRFASDAALLRAVAAQHVGLYAIESSRARRMTVSDSRISFWDASTPNAFHEMEHGTVPTAVIRALERAGADSTATSWGVTLPGRMRSQLDELMQTHRGGLLIITADGDIHWEAS